MKRIGLLIWVIIMFTACNDGADVRGIPGPEEVETAVPEPVDLSNEVAGLEERGFEVSIYEVEEEKYIRQKYFLVLFKEVAEKDPATRDAAELQELHLNYLRNLEKEGYVSLSGPVDTEGAARGITVLNTPTLQMADSLARMDPLVKAGAFEVEIFPWWVTKGGKLE